MEKHKQPVKQLPSQRDPKTSIVSEPITIEITSRYWLLDVPDFPHGFQPIRNHQRDHKRNR